MTIFELEVASRPQARVDNRKVVEARFFTPARALEIKRFPLLRRRIERHAKIPGPAQPGSA